MAKRLASHVMPEAQPRSPAQGAKPMRTSSGNGGQNASEAIQSTKHGSQDASKAAQPSYDNSSEDAPLAIQPSSDGGSQGDSLAIQPTSDNSTQDALESIQGGTIFNSAEPGKTGKTSSGNIYINASNSNGMNQLDLSEARERLTVCMDSPHHTNITGDRQQYASWLQ